MNSRTYLLLVIIVSFLPFLSIFTTPDLPHTSDGGVHLPRLGAYVKALRDGHLTPRWAGDLNYGYGLPLFNFIYPVPYLIGSLFVTSGFNLVTSFKLILLVSFLLSGIFMYMLSNALFKKPSVAFLVTILYQFAPFRLVEILVRGAMGGIYAYTFLPLVLFGILKLQTNKNWTHLLITALATALLLLSHNSLSLVFFAMILLFTLMISKNIGDFLYPFLALTLGIGLSAFYWMPALFEHKYTYGDLFMKDLYKSHFPPLINFFIPNIFNLEKFRTAEISVQIGLIQTLILFIAIYAYLKKLIKNIFLNRIVLFSLLTIAISFFFMQPVSLLLWEKIALLRQFQFPWRFLAVPAFSLALLSGALITHKKLKVAMYWLIIITTIFTTAYFWRPPQGFDKVNEQDFWNYPLNTTYFGETDVIWSAGPANAYPNNRVEIIAGQGQVSEFKKKTQIHSYIVSAETPVRLVDHTQYFPGWRVYVDQAKAPIEFQDQNYRGLITFNVPAGLHQIRVVFEESKIRFLADMISLGFLIAIAIGCLTGLLTHCHSGKPVRRVRNPSTSLKTDQILDKPE